MRYLIPASLWLCGNFTPLSWSTKTRELGQELSMANFRHVTPSDSLYLERAEQGKYHRKTTCPSDLMGRGHSSCPLSQHDDSPERIPNTL